MVLYFIKTTYQLLECIVHKITVHEKEDAVLLINNGHIKNYPNYEQLSEFGFKKIIIYSTGKITSPETTVKKKFVDDIVKYYNDLLEKNVVNMNEISHIYSFAALRFSIYLLETKRKFSLFEDGVGAAKELGLVLWRENLDKIDKKSLAKQYGLLDGSNNLISHIYYNDSKGVLDSNKAIIYDISKELKKIDKINMDNIISFFGGECVDTEQSVDNLILFRHCYANDEELDRKQNKLLEFILDWFGVEGNFVVKTHPMDNANYQLSSKIKWIHKQLPSELLPYIIGNKVLNLVAVATTSFYSFSDRAFRTCFLSYDITEMQNGIRKQIMFLNLMKEVELLEYKFSIYGMYTQISKIVIGKYYKNDIDVTWGNFSISEKKVLMIDKLTWGNPEKNCKKQLQKFMRNCNLKSIIVFIDSDNNFKFCESINEEMLKHMLLFHIEYDSQVGVRINDYLYIWCKDEELRKQMAYCKSKKFLPFTRTISKISIVEGWEKLFIQKRLGLEMMKE